MTGGTLRGCCLTRDGEAHSHACSGPPVDADRAAREVLAAEEKATPGPWRYAPFIRGVTQMGDNGLVIATDMREGDSDFIALARTAAPLLAAEVLRLRETLGDYETQLGRTEAWLRRAEAERDAAWKELGGPPGPAALASSPGREGER